MFNVCNQQKNYISKLLAIAQQFEFPIRQYPSVTCFSSPETKSRNLFIPSALTVTKNNILGTNILWKTLKKVVLKFSP